MPTAAKACQYFRGAATLIKQPSPSRSPISSDLGKNNWLYVCRWGVIYMLYPKGHWPIVGPYANFCHSICTKDLWVN